MLMPLDRMRVRHQFREREPHANTGPSAKNAMMRRAEGDPPAVAFAGTCRIKALSIRSGALRVPPDCRVVLEKASTLLAGTQLARVI